MRIGVRHEIRFRFEPPVKSVIASLRLTPRNHEGQYISAWRIDLNVDCRLKSAEDAFGNLTYMFDCASPDEGVVVDVSGEVETFDTAGVLRGTVERFPPELYLRETPLTSPDQALRSFAEDAAGSGETLGRLHELLAKVHGSMELTEDAAAMTPAAAALQRGSGGAADLAHVFIAAARHLAIPARFASGYFALPEGAGEPRLRSEDAGCARPGHAWAEAFVPRLGWVGFDPAKGNCPEDSHVRTAVGLDCIATLPIRSAHIGTAIGSGESRIRVTGSQPQRTN